MSMILVTGGAGYIGSHTVKQLLRLGHQPIVYDNLQTGHSEAVENTLFIQGDLCDHHKLKRTFQSYPIKTVIHFAADCLVGESVLDPTKYFTNNVRNALRLVETMDQFSVRSIVFSCSAAVYGEPETIPIREEHQCRPTNPYGETTLIFEKVLQSLHYAQKLDYVSLRYFNAAGADPEGDLGEDHSHETHLIPLVIRAALEGIPVSVLGTDYDTPDGTCIRDYIHVTDLAHAHILALRKFEQEGNSRVYNLGNGNGHSVREVIRTVEKVTGKKITSVDSPRRPGDPGRLVASSQKIRKELGWVPNFPDLETIVETAYRWHRHHPNGF